MSIKLLPASVNPIDPSQASDASTGLVPLTQRAIAARAGQISLVPSAGAFAWSSSPRQTGPTRIHGTFVEDSQADETGRQGEYLSGWSWTHSIERSVIAHYLSYVASPAGWTGRLIDLYA
jgi:hypothetical protein